MSLFVLDTDHLSLYQRRFEPLLSRLLAHPAHELAITIVTVEEQLRGRLAQIRKASTSDRLIERYLWLGETVVHLSKLPILYFDSDALKIYEKLVAQKIRVGSHDLRIAAIVLSRNAVLLTRNGHDFARVPGLRLHDWTV